MKAVVIIVFLANDSLVVLLLLLLPQLVGLDLLQVGDGGGVDGPAGSINGAGIAVAASVTPGSLVASEGDSVGTSSKAALGTNLFSSRTHQAALRGGLIVTGFTPRRCSEARQRDKKLTLMSRLSASTGMAMLVPY